MDKEKTLTFKAHQTQAATLQLIFAWSLLAPACSSDSQPQETFADASRPTAALDAASAADAAEINRLPDATMIDSSTQVFPDAALDAGEPAQNKYVHPDYNNNGRVDILVIGTSSELNGGRGFLPGQIVTELKNILDGDNEITGEVNIVAEDIYTSKDVTIGLGGNGSEQVYRHHRHSLAQYLYWPEGAETRIENLQGNGSYDWDYVLIGADPYIATNMPGYYALGVHKVATHVAEGNAQAMLLMMWSRDQSQTALFEEFSYRTADGAPTSLPVVPAGLAWAALPNNQQDNAQNTPSPNGAYLAAASIYSQMTNSSASSSSYEYNTQLAEVALSTVNQANNEAHYSGDFAFNSPFAGCEVKTSTLTYNHTGTSSERGILNGLNWIFSQATETLERGNNSLTTFNYGRANSNFEANKRYQIDATRFQYSFGFPMQDHGNHGDISMLYGLDKRNGGVVNDTDLGVGRFMIEQSELPYARAVPIRTLYAQMKEVTPSQSAYRDAWHMHRDLDKSIGAFMYTLLTNKCSLGTEPSDASSSAWRTWKAHKIGCDTAWTLMYLEKSPF